MPSACGNPVYSLWARLWVIEGLFHGLFAKLEGWLQTHSLYPALSNICTQLKQLVVDIFTPVIGELSALCTAPIITITIKLRRY